jgi:hypothetical protein
MPHTTTTRFSASAALVAGVALFATAAEALPPGVAPPWANSTTTTTETTTTTTPAASPAAPVPAAVPTAVPDAQSPPTTEPGVTTPVPVAVTPMEGTTTPIHPVSLRAGPNSSFPVIGTLRPGDQLRVLATANYGWMQVDSPVGSGWAYGSYLAPSSGEAVPPPVPITHP